MILKIIWYTVLHLTLISTTSRGRKGPRQGPLELPAGLGRRWPVPPRKWAQWRSPSLYGKIFPLHKRRETKLKKNSLILWILLTYYGWLVRRQTLPFTWCENLMVLTIIWALFHYLDKSFLLNIFSNLVALVTSLHIFPSFLFQKQLCTFTFRGFSINPQWIYFLVITFHLYPARVTVLCLLAIFSDKHLCTFADTASYWYVLHQPCKIASKNQPSKPSFVSVPEKVHRGRLSTALLSRPLLSTSAVFCFTQHETSGEYTNVPFLNVIYRTTALRGHLSEPCTAFGSLPGHSIRQKIFPDAILPLCSGARTLAEREILCAHSALLAPVKREGKSQFAHGRRSMSLRTSRTIR